MRTAALAALTLSLIPVGSLRGADKPWTEVKSPNFTVVTNADEKKARKVAWQFEQIRAVMAKVWPWAQLEMSRPILILAAKDEKTMRSLVPKYFEGGDNDTLTAYVTSSDRHYVTLRADLESDPGQGHANPYRGAYWSYVSVALDNSMGVRLPPWIQRGIAEFFSNTVVREKEVLVGIPIVWELERLRTRGRPTVADLVNATYDSQLVRDDYKREVFDAASWALVHMTLFHQKGAYRAGLTAYMNAIAKGKNGAAAAESLGDLSRIQDDLAVYIDKKLYTYVRMPLAVDVKPETFPARPMTPAQSAARRAGLHVAMGRSADALTVLDEARRIDPKEPAVAEVEGLIADREDKDAEARSAYRRAADGSSESDHVYYRLAQLEWKQGADKAHLEANQKLLRRAVELNPQSAGALSYLAEVTADLGNAAEGLLLVQRAIKLEPSRSYHYAALAHVYWVLRQADNTRQAAEVAMRAATTDGERRRAQWYLDNLAKNVKP